MRMILDLDKEHEHLAHTLVGDSVFGEDGEPIGWVGPILENSEWDYEEQDRKSHVRKQTEKMRQALREFERAWCWNLKQRDNFLDANHQMSGTIKRLKELCTWMYHDMQDVLKNSTDTVWVGDFGTLRGSMDAYMQDMAELGFPPNDYKQRMRELGRESEVGTFNADAT